MPSFPSPRRRYHFQTPGVVYVLVTILVALGAFNSQNNLLFWAFGLALAVLIVSGIISGQMLMGIQVTREAPARTVAGLATTVRYRVANHSRLASAFALEIVEAPSERVVGAPAFVVHVGPRGAVEAEGVVTPATRGVLRLTGPIVSSAFPFGIIRKSLRFAQASTILVHPAPVELPAGVRRALSGVGRGRTQSRPQMGEGTEFFALREYVPGDPPTRIAWRASARSRDLLVRQTTHEEPRSVWVVLDLAASGAGEGEADAARERVERAIGVAGQCVRELTGAGVACGLAVPGADIQIVPRAAANQVLTMLDALAALDAGGSVRPAPFPARALRSGAAVIVHAGAVNPGFGPANAVRVSALDAAGVEAPMEAGA